MADELTDLPQELEKKLGLQSTESRTVLIVGPSKSGKSSVLGLLTDPCYDPQKSRSSSEPDLRSYAVNDKDASAKYILHLVDAPGSSSTTLKQHMVNTLKTCFKNSVSKFHTLLICFNFVDSVITPEDVLFLKSCIENLYLDQVSLLICITHTENKTDTWQKRMMDLLMDQPFFAQVLSRKNARVLFVGSVDNSYFKKLSNIENLKKLYTIVYNKREDLLKTIFNSSSAAALGDLPIAQVLQEEVVKLLQRQNEIIEFLDGSINFDHERVPSAIDEFTTNIKLLAPLIAHLHKEVFSLAWDAMQVRLVPLLAKMPENVKKQMHAKLANFGQ